MKTEFLKRFKKLFVWGILIFGILFLFRLAYGYTLKISEGDTEIEAVYFDALNNSRNNYASKKYKRNNTIEGNTSLIQVDQKYEKVADIKTKSENYSAEEKSTRNKIEQQKAVIQFEQKSGNSGNRKLSFIIGVPPENFDKLYEQLIKIGKVQAKLITKTDKTNEFKELNAKRESLEKIRQSLIELKSKGGKIDEYMSLENRILEIEQSLQNLGVSLGDFDAVNEFCTVKFSLAEIKTTEKASISFMHRLKVAFEWTIKMYIGILTAVLLLSGCVLLILFIVDKTKFLQEIVSKIKK
jgi:hypothetical protein